MSDTSKLVPDPRARVVHRGDETTILGRDGTARRLSGDSAALARAVLDFVTGPRSRDEILAHVAELAGAPLESTETIDELLRLLLDAKIFHQRDDAATTAPAGAALHQGRVLVGLTGAVASMHGPLLVQLLLARGFDVRVALTRDARRFVRPLGLEALTHAPVASSLWPGASTSRVPHLELAEWAELVLICPASATTISRIAQGDCSDLVAAAAIATRAPVAIVPSMNEAMLRSPSVTRNLERLREDGFFIVQSGFGFELAQAPGRRSLAVGPALAFDAVADVVQLILRRPAAPDWERLYAGARASELPWHTDVIEPEVAAALSRRDQAPGRAIDIGAGAGTFAIEAARRGWVVTATELAPSALAHARARANGANIAWVLDDILASRIEGPFELVHDRGVLHGLRRDQWALYAGQIARLTAPSGRFFLKTHVAHAPHPDDTVGFTGTDLANLFHPAFTLEHLEESAFLGPGEPVRALFAVFTRR